ncbi:LuxR C-terminal-related transcriptional regulator [Streptomyces sp. NPDC006704]|uniref:helix-turn-helix transcriptional regulator n=1 Tax=Streptomyces sp. NPDC006704 TaxID=3364760 RepID=UPI0036BCCC74
MDPDIKGLSDRACALYLQIEHSYVPDPADPALAELIQAGLVTPIPSNRGAYARLNLCIAERNRTSQLLDDLERHVAALRSLPQFFDSLPKAATETGGITLLPGIKEANASMTAASAQARHEVITCHPRDRPTSSVAAKDRDAKLAARGVRFRTIYPHSARARQPEQEYGRAIAEAGGEIRTLTPPFERMVVIDRTHAYVSDYLDTPSPDTPCWLVTHPAIVAILVNVFDTQWVRAARWIGGTSHQADQRTTSPQQRAILRLMEDGCEDNQIADTLHISKRTLSTQIAEIKALFGVETRFQIGSTWARHPDYLAD